MVRSVSPLNKKEPNGIQETNVRPVKSEVVEVIQVDFTLHLRFAKTPFNQYLHSLIWSNTNVVKEKAESRIYCYSVKGRR